MWQEAVERLTVAIERATRNYTRPKDGEAYYYLGVALRGEDKNAEAADAFHRASWSEAWTAASYYELAELDGQKGEWSQALSDLDHALAYGMLNCRAWDLKAATLRKLGRPTKPRRLPIKLWPSIRSTFGPSMNSLC